MSIDFPFAKPTDNEKFLLLHNVFPVDITMF